MSQSIASPAVSEPDAATTTRADVAATNGVAAASFLAGAIGAAAYALATALAAFRLFTPPDFYPAVGNLTGKLAIGMAAWLIAWVVLHVRWRGQQVNIGRIAVVTVALAVAAVLATILPFLIRGA
jgi:hypothetical protein